MRLRDTPHRRSLGIQALPRESRFSGLANSQGVLSISAGCGLSLTPSTVQDVLGTVILSVCNGFDKALVVFSARAISVLGRSGAIMIRYRKCCLNTMSFTPTDA